jgi:hypothetical protein
VYEILNQRKPRLMSPASGGLFRKLGLVGYKVGRVNVLKLLVEWSMSIETGQPADGNVLTILFRGSLSTYVSGIGVLS